MARRGRVRHRGWAAFSQEGTQQQRAGLLPADATANGEAAAAVVAKDISEASAAAARSMRQPSCSMVPWGRPARRIGACCGAPAQHAAAAPLVRLWKGVLFRTFFAGGAHPTHCAALLKTPAPSRRCRGRRPRKHQTEAERRAQWRGDTRKISRALAHTNPGNFSALAHAPQTRPATTCLTTSLWKYITWNYPLKTLFPARISLSGIWKVYEVSGGSQVGGGAQKPRDPGRAAAVPPLPPPPGPT